METNTFGEDLQEYRRMHGLTQRRMAELLGVSPNHVGVLERGIKHPRPSTEEKFVRLSGNVIRQTSRMEKALSASDLETYKIMWVKLNCMKAERRGEILHMFLRIVEWVRYK